MLKWSLYNGSKQSFLAYTLYKNCTCALNTSALGEEYACGRKCSGRK